MRILPIITCVLTLLSGPVFGQVIILPDTEDEEQLGVIVDQINRLSGLIDDAEGRITRATDGLGMHPDDFLRYYRQRGRLRACDGGTVANSDVAFATLDSVVTDFFGEPYMGTTDGFGFTPRIDVDLVRRNTAYDTGLGAGCSNRARLEARILSSPVGQLLILGKNRDEALALRQRYERLLLTRWADVHVLVPTLPIDQLD